MKGRWTRIRDVAISISICVHLIFIYGKHAFLGVLGVLAVRSPLLMEELGDSAGQSLRNIAETRDVIGGPVNAVRTGGDQNELIDGAGAAGIIAIRVA